MSNVCHFCEKKPSVGKSLTYRGLPKKQGGIGLKITGNPKRRFMPNLQRVKAMIAGAPKYVKVCASCIKKGLVVKA